MWLIKPEKTTKIISQGGRQHLFTTFITNNRPLLHLHEKKIFLKF